jgi:hypothetical protein
MSDSGSIVLEVLSGPLDGERIELREAAEWSRIGKGPLVFPWDVELGAPQARVVPGPEGWTLEPIALLQSISLITRDEKVSGPVLLVEGDVLRAATCWLRVEAIEPRGEAS